MACCTGETFGAASLRRQAQALRLRPDLKPAPFLRGNVETRLSKAEAGAVGATLLALAGLKRLGLAHRARAVLGVDKFLPAPGQGAIRSPRAATHARALEALNAISDDATTAALIAERAFLAELEGSRAARRLQPLPASRPGGSRFWAKCCAPTVPSGSASPPRVRSPTGRVLGAMRAVTSRAACPRACS